MRENSSRHIYITGLQQMPRWVRELGPTHLVSLVQPEFQPPRPPEISAARHLRVAVHDIEEPNDFEVLVQERDILDLLDFLERWQPEEGSLLVHCIAGVSRSTASAMIAHFLKTGDANASARALRAAAPHAMPNRRIVALADAALGQGGALLAAANGLGPPNAWLEGETLSVLTL